MYVLISPDKRGGNSSGLVYQLPPFPPVSIPYVI